MEVWHPVAKTVHPVRQGGRCRRSSVTSTLCQLGMQTRHRRLSSFPAGLKLARQRAVSDSAVGPVRLPRGCRGFRGSTPAVGTPLGRGPRIVRLCRSMSGESLFPLRSRQLHVGDGAVAVAHGVVRGRARWLGWRPRCPLPVRASARWCGRAPVGASGRSRW